jgi:hypothetical protein
MGHVWIGMAEVSIGPHCILELSGAGAFVWCATQANGESMFIQKAEEMLTHYGLIPVGFENVRCVDDLTGISEDLAEIVMRAGENPDYVLYGTFQTFNHHTA